MKRFLVLSPVLFFTGCVVLPAPERDQAWAPPPAAPTFQPMSPPPPPPPETAPLPVVVEMPPLLERSEIIFVYESTLDRRPSDREVWEWRERSRQQTISPDDVRRALHDSNEFRQVVPDRVIRRAFLDYHHLEPDLEVLRLYRRRMIDEGWSINRVREDISRRTVELKGSQPPRDGRGPSGEDHSRGRNGDDERKDDRGRRDAQERRDGGRDPRSFNSILIRAYNDVLERKPDPAGQAHYLRKLEEGASEEEIRASLRASEEFRVTLPDSKTKRAYQEVLHREPDEGGLQHYRKLIVDKGWTEGDVKNDLRKSAEYRNRKS